MSLALCKALSALSFWKPSTTRGFSSSLVRVTDVSRPAKSVEEHSLADKEKEARERNRVYIRAWRQRLRDDPERWKAYKTRGLAAYKEWFKRIKEDPERYKEYQSRKQKRREHNYQDLSLRDRVALAKRERYKERVGRDPEFVEISRERSRRWHARRSDLSRITRKLRNWNVHSWVRQLPWKSHTPIFSQDKVRQCCATCGTYRIDGAMLWWQRLTPSDPPLYDCQTCFARSYPSCMPEGYEDVENLPEMKARKKQLDYSTKKQTRKVPRPENDKRED